MGGDGRPAGEDVVQARAGKKYAMESTAQSQTGQGATIEGTKRDLKARKRNIIKDTRSPKRPGNES